MWGTQTIISAADTTLMSTIFNGVAIICSQSGLIFSIATLASMFRLFMMLPTYVISGTNHTVLRTGLKSAFLAPIFAVLLTNGDFKSTVQIENNMTGAVTVVDNVPIIISAVPAVASTMAVDIGNLVQTAFQGANSQWSLIGGNGQGLLQPLKLLLGARTALARTGKVTADFTAVMSTCLGTDSGMPAADINRLVLNAGNPGGATAGQVITVSPSTTVPTSAGAMLWAAAQNQTGRVLSMLPNPDGKGAKVDMAPTCPVAAMTVATEINDALNSPALSQVLTSAVSGSDNPNNVKPFTFTDLTTSFNGLRVANGANNVMAQGQSQANAELINLMMAQTVSENLKCINANAADKVACLASMQQTQAIEASNLDNAANAQVFTTLAGQFANFMLALIIGLGPIIVIFMMFAGVSAGKNIKVAAHMIVWPMLIYNVGIVLINGMMFATVSSFMQTLSWGAVITQANAAEIYRNLSMEIGTASALMAALPVLMSTVFALGESAAWVSLANTAGGKDRFDESKVAGASSIVTGRNAADVILGANGSAQVSYAGGTDPVKMSQQAQAAHQAQESWQQSEATKSSISRGQTYANALSSGDTHKIAETFGVSEDSAKKLSENYQVKKQLAAQGGFNIGGSVGGSSGKEGGGVSGKLGASIGADASKNWAVGQTLDIARNDSSSYKTSDGHSKDFGNVISDVQNFQQSLSKESSVSRSLSEANTRTGSFVGGLDVGQATASNVMQRGGAGATVLAAKMGEKMTGFSSQAQETATAFMANMSQNQTNGINTHDSYPGSDRFAQQLGANRAVFFDPKSSESDKKIAFENLSAFGKFAYGDPTGSTNLQGPAQGNYTMGPTPTNTVQKLDRAQVATQASSKPQNNNAKLDLQDPRNETDTAVGGPSVNNGPWYMPSGPKAR